MGTAPSTSRPKQSLRPPATLLRSGPRLQPVHGNPENLLQGGTNATNKASTPWAHLRQPLRAADIVINPTPNCYTCGNLVRTAPHHCAAPLSPASPFPTSSSLVATSTVQACGGNALLTQAKGHRVDNSCQQQIPASATDFLSAKEQGLSPEMPQATRHRSRCSGAATHQDCIQGRPATGLRRQRNYTTSRRSCSGQLFMVVNRKVY